MFIPSLKRSLKAFFLLYLDWKMLIVLILGFCGGLPLVLYSSTLAYWMAQEGVNLKTIGLFGLASFPASFKFIWAPLIDRLPIPFLTKLLGQRRAWLLVSQLLSIGSLYGMGLCHPSQGHLTILALLALLTALGAANQNVLILTYQVEGFSRKTYGATEAVCVLGYRIGLVVAGALPLYLSIFWSWQHIYQLMSLISLAGVVVTLFMKEPKRHLTAGQKNFERNKKLEKTFRQHPRWLAFLAWMHGAVICPLKVFIRHKGWVASLLIMLLYKAGDNMIGAMSNIFYNHQGYSATDIANAAKIFGMWSSVAGGILGGYIISRISIYKGLFFFGIIHSFSLFSYLLISFLGTNLSILYFVSGIEHFTGGLSLTALFSYQMLLSDPRYATTQLALLTSFSHMGRSLFAAPAGYLIEACGWEGFFLLTGILSMVVLPLVVWLGYYKNEWVRVQSPLSSQNQNEN